jgi:transcriptional regulator with XRE-family HTH domain
MGTGTASALVVDASPASSSSIDHELVRAQCAIENARILDQIGPSIKKMRAVNGLSQKQLAVLTGKSRPEISRFERGETIPTLGTIKDIAGAFGLTLGEFFGDCLAEATPIPDPFVRKILEFRQCFSPKIRKAIAQRLQRDQRHRQLKTSCAPQEIRLGEEVRKRTRSGSGNLPLIVQQALRFAHTEDWANHMTPRQLAGAIRKRIAEVISANALSETTG